jgi:hypothetical protein
LLTRDEARRIAAQRRQAAGLAGQAANRALRNNTKSARA